MNNITNTTVSKSRHRHTVENTSEYRCKNFDDKLTIILLLFTTTSVIKDYERRDMPQRQNAIGND